MVGELMRAVAAVVVAVLLAIAVWAACVIPSDAAFPNSGKKYGFSGGCGGPKTIFTASPTGNNALTPAQSLRQVANGLSPSTGCTQVRVTYKSGTGSVVMNNVSVGIQVTAGQTSAIPTELLFSGGHGFTIGASTSITSEWTATTMPGASNLIVVGDCSATCNVGNTATSIEYFETSPTYNLANPAGLSNVARLDGLSKIEVQ
jgi:hypothetical protein